MVVGGWVQHVSGQNEDEKGSDRLRIVELREGLARGIVGLPPESRMRSMGYGIVLGSPRGISQRTVGHGTGNHVRNYWTH